VHYLAEKCMLFFQIFQKIIQSSLLPSFCHKFFHQSLSSITFELMDFLLKYNTFLHKPILTMSAPDGCHGNKQCWYPFSSKLASYLLED